MGDPSDVVTPRTRPCDNCKRDIPEDNFTIHSIHCTRNIRVCQHCKEPVAIVDMEKHTAQVPCSQCGEVMQYCDLPSHKTDACSLTQIRCIYCELSLERIAMANHELYCGTRTEQCPECKEFVMIKYKKLHEDSNHGFLKLDDEPGPQPSWKSNPRKTIGVRVPVEKDTTVKKLHTDKLKVRSTVKFSTNTSPECDQEQPSHSGGSKGAIKKRVAPQPPTDSNLNLNSKSKHNVAVLKPFKHTRDVPAYKALEREQTQRRNMEEENVHRRENNLPPLLNSSEKIEKLRKLCALQNLNSPDEYRAYKKKDAPASSNVNEITDDNYQPKNVNKKTDKNNRLKHDSVDNSGVIIYDSEVIFPEDSFDSTKNKNKLTKSVKNVNENPLKPSQDDNVSNIDNTNSKLRRAKKTRNPQFLDYSDSLNSLLPINDEYRHDIQLTDRNNQTKYEPKPVDRFCEIKNDLRALRKDLKECTSPLENRRSVNKAPEIVPSNKLNNLESSNNREQYDPLDLYRITNETNSDDVYVDGSLNDVMLPCEFCEQMIQANSLVAHETGCRPNITSFASNKNRSSIVENMAPPNTPDRHQTPKISNLNINSEKQVNINKVSNKESLNVNSNSNDQNSFILPSDEEDDEAAGDLDEVKLPCEFCMTLVPACRLVWHQEACYAA